MPRHFEMLAHYNRWANTLLYDAVAHVSDVEFHENRGAFFGSLCGTLNHLLVADQIWMRRFTGTGEAAASLNVILHDDLVELRAAREAEDRRIIEWVETLDDDALAAEITYSPISIPGAITHPLGPAVAHLFNHQTHHRGQCHMTLTAMGKPSLWLDLMHFLREEGRRWM
ncbi:damage-inducible protein DinB [Rhizobium lusitanum]|uniref:DinB family protein n=1 Tax=Rhizobium lusitanum TaxID=293958 RepID=UPI00160AF1CB|nr:DinB family protein [Rhizobium lusitanum]QND50089.1 damage-inducible protein DinB [Rhizobium lusitanum]